MSILTLFTKNLPGLIGSLVGFSIFRLLVLSSWLNAATFCRCISSLTYLPSTQLNTHSKFISHIKLEMAITETVTTEVIQISMLCNYVVRSNSYKRIFYSKSMVYASSVLTDSNIYDVLGVGKLIHIGYLEQLNLALVICWKPYIIQSTTCISFQNYSHNSDFVSICDHFSENSHGSHKHAYWKKWNLKIICEITHAAGKYLWGLMEPAISEGSFKSTKTIFVPSYSPGYGEFENLCFGSIACVTCICLQCGRHKQNCYRFLGKTATID